MTRENKVALVIGFALVLLVGILISDHLSKAQTQRSANLVPVSARDDSPRGARLIDLARDQAPLPTPRPEVRDHDPATATAIASPPVETAPPPTEIAPPTTATAEAPAPRVHRVSPGEALSKICARYYGTASLTQRLAEYNGLRDPDNVWAGRVLEMPPAETLTGKGVPMPAPEVDAPPAPRAYTVGPGDTLSSIAGRLLGSPAKWRRLYELNRDVISDPDEVKAGTVLRINAE